MAEELESQSTLVLRDMNKMVLFATQSANLVTMESAQSAGNRAHLVGLMKEPSVDSHSSSMEKDAAVHSSDVVITVQLVTLMMVVLAEDLLKLWRRVPMVVELESH